jgi:hypothetical protein
LYGTLVAIHLERAKINLRGGKTKMKCLLTKFLLVFLLILLGCGSAFAIPSLQLDIKNGTYVGGTEETVFATSDPFTLYALLIPTSTTLLGDTYYISAALRPKTMTSGDWGSFTFDGTTVNVTNDMVYGVPPLESNAAAEFDPKDLSTHGIFETYFKEFSFKFNPNNTASAYNTQDYAGQGPTANTDGTMYYASFSIDTSDLAAGYSIHFDLYNEKVVAGGDIDRNQFAPFSHDANSTTNVPEPSTMLLLASGLAGVGVIALRRQR